ncbi:hypothetical protein ACLOJK_022222 [Asimina triloba]
MNMGQRRQDSGGGIKKMKIRGVAKMIVLVVAVLLGFAVRESEGDWFYDKTVIKFRNYLDYEVYVFCEREGEELMRSYKELAPRGMGIKSYRWSRWEDLWLDKVWCHIWHKGMWRQKKKKTCRFVAYSRSKHEGQCEEEGCVWELTRTGMDFRRARYEQSDIEYVPYKYRYCKDWRLR